MARASEILRAHVPPCTCFLSLVPVNKTTQAHHSSQSEHNGVETQPGKVDADLLAVILPVERNHCF